MRLLFGTLGLALLCLSTASSTAAPSPFGPVPSAIADPVTVPSEGARAVSVEDFRPRALETSTFSEVWSYLFLLEGGMQANFSLSQANLGRVMGAVSGAEFAVSGFNGQTYRVAREYAATDLAFTPGSHRLQVHPDMFVEGALPQRHRVYFKTTKDDVSYEVDLTMTDIARGFTWGDGVFHLGAHRVGMFIHVPYARVSGTITLNGTTRRVSGTAYMDHTYQTDFATRLIRGAYRYVQHGPNPEVGYFIQPASRYDDQVIGFGGVRRGGGFQLQRPSEIDIISTRTSRGVAVPRQMAVRYDGGRQTILNRGTDQHSFSVMDELSSIQRAVVRRFVGGEAHVFRGRGTTNLREPVVYDYVIVR